MRALRKRRKEGLAGRSGRIKEAEPRPQPPAQVEEEVEEVQKEETGHSDLLYKQAIMQCTEDTRQYKDDTMQCKDDTMQSKGDTMQCTEHTMQCPEQLQEISDSNSSSETEAIVIDPMHFIQFGNLIQEINDSLSEINPEDQVPVALACLNLIENYKSGLVNYSK